MIWAVTYAGFGLGCALSGASVFRGEGPEPGWSGWLVAAVGAVAALTCGAVVWRGPRPPLRVLLWALCGLALASAFSLLMDVITLMFGQDVSSWTSVGNRALAAVGALLLATVARSGRRPPAADFSDAIRPVGSRPAQLAARAGTLAFLPYVAMKQVWATGGTFAGLSGEESLAISRRNGASELWLTLESWGLDGTVLLALIGVLLIWALVRPWGLVFPRWTWLLSNHRVPRWLPLAPALVGAATLAPYGVLGICYLILVSVGVMDMRPGDFPSSQDALLVSWIGMIAFAVYGVALVVAAHSYWLRSRLP